MSDTYPAVTPDRLTYIIGDIHGRIDLLDRLLSRIQEDSGGAPADIIAVGDIVDRGEDSASVLEKIHQLDRQSKGAFVCLMGNHEKMMLDFLAEPEERGSRWLRNGGLQTLASFGVGQVTEASGPDELRQARENLAKVLPAHLAAWIAARPLIWTSGNLVVVHAALDPDLPPTAQSDRTLLWGHPEFLKKPRTDGLWVAHGHTVVGTPQRAETRIAVDTGAYFSGKLTAAAIEPGKDLRFLQT